MTETDSSIPVMPELTLAILSSMNDGKDPRQLEQIVMPNKMIARISDEITGKCKLIKKIDLSKNLLTDVAPIFQNHLPNLTWVSFANNQLSRITFPHEDDSDADSAYKWRIKVFNASGNQLRDIGFLQYLGDDVKAIILTNNEIRDMSGLSETTRAFRSGLDTLVLSHNKIERVSESLATLESLSKLNLGNNLLREIPAGVFRMTRLRELRLNGNKIMNIPGSDLWQRLPNLSILDLGNNQIFNVDSVKNLAPLARSLVQANFLGNPIAPVSGVEGKSSDKTNEDDMQKYSKYKALILSILPNLTNLDNSSLRKAKSDFDPVDNDDDNNRKPRKFRDSPSSSDQPKAKREFKKGDNENKREFKKRDNESKREFKKGNNESKREFKKFDNESKHEFKKRDGESKHEFKKRDDGSKHEFKKFDGKGKRKPFRKDSVDKDGDVDMSEKGARNERFKRKDDFAGKRKRPVKSESADEDTPEEVHGGFSMDEKMKLRNAPGKVVVKKRETVSESMGGKKAVRMVFDDDGEGAKKVRPAAPKSFDQPPPQKKARPAAKPNGDGDIVNNDDFIKIRKNEKPVKKQFNKERPQKGVAEKAKREVSEKKKEVVKKVEKEEELKKKKNEIKKKEEKEEEDDDDGDSGLVEVKKTRPVNAKTAKASKAVMQALLANPDEEISSW